MRELDGDALVVGAVVIERVGHVSPHGTAHLCQRGEAAALGAGAWVLAHHLGVLDLLGGHAGRAVARAQVEVLGGSHVMPSCGWGSSWRTRSPWRHRIRAP